MERLALTEEVRHSCMRCRLVLYAMLTRADAILTGAVCDANRCCMRCYQVLYVMLTDAVHVYVMLTGTVCDADTCCMRCYQVLYVTLTGAVCNANRCYTLT